MRCRTTAITPMSSNVQLLLYHCTEGPFVRLTHNEEELPMPLCDGKTYCPYSVFHQALQKRLSGVASFSELCGLSEAQKALYESHLSEVLTTAQAPSEAPQRTGTEL